MCGIQNMWYSDGRTSGLGQPHLALPFVAYMTSSLGWLSYSLPMAFLSRCSMFLASSTS
jgi:hypothetical protein